MAKKTGKVLLCLTVAAAAIGGVLAYLKTRENDDTLDEDFDDFTDGFEADDEPAPERSYTTLSKDALNRAKETAGDVKDAAADIASEAADAVVEAIDAAAAAVRKNVDCDAVKDAFQDAKDTASEIGEEIKHAAGDIASELRSELEKEDVDEDPEEE